MDSHLASRQRRTDSPRARITARRSGTDTPIMQTLLLLALLTAQPKAQCQPQFRALDTGTTSGDSNISFWRKEEAAPWRGDGWIGWTHLGERLEPIRLTIKDRPKVENDDDAYLTVEPDREVSYAVRVTGCCCRRGRNEGSWSEKRACSSAAIDPGGLPTPKSTAFRPIIERRRLPSRCRIVPPGCTG
jgi:hypothetical protein